jgi:hypothetical protein
MQGSGSVAQAGERPAGRDLVLHAVWSAAQRWGRLTTQQGSGLWVRLVAQPSGNAAPGTERGHVRSCELAGTQK